jgi:predicted RNA methylase
MSTSAIVAQVVDAPDDIASLWLPAAAELGAPAVLTALHDSLTLWATAPDAQESAEILTVPVVAPTTLVDRIANLGPEAIARTKRISDQRSLFPLGLEILNNSRKRAHTYLTEQVESCLSLVAGRRSGQKDLAARLVIGALAILMIRDKSSPVASSQIGSGALVDIAQQRYPGYFEWINELNESQLQSLDTIVGYLESDINFAAIEPSMASEVYEQALVNKLVRREQGTFYTPPQLARQMLAVVPFESLEPDRRSVLDPACGSGTMLLAAATRLSEAQPEKVDPASMHRYLTSRLSGYDSDSLASEITKLCLLMTAMPLGNSWDVETVDTLTKSLDADRKPSVIVSNPPWQYRRQGEQPEERANVFLSWMLENLSDDGYMACVVPLSWVNKVHSERARISLLQRADLLEVWRLPPQLFRSTSSAIAPAVIVAKKHSRGYRSRLAIFKTVRDSGAKVFLNTGRADEAYLVEPGPEGEALAAGPLSRELAQNVRLGTLAQTADVYTGWSQRSERPERTGEDASHLELDSIRKLNAFAAPQLDTLRPSRYPDDYHHVRATDERVRASKVVVVSKHFSTDNPWRLNVGFDPFGIVVRESFISIIPRSSWAPWSHLTEWERQCAVMAVLGSGLASCWIDENEPTRNISIRYIKAMPFPAEAESISLLARAGDRMVRAVEGSDHSALSEMASRLDETVNDVYELTEGSRELIRYRLAGAEAFEGVIRYPVVSESGVVETNNSVEVPSFGHTLDATEHGIRIWVSGITEFEGAYVPTPLQIPGILCKRGTDFTVEGDLLDLRKARYAFHKREWLSGEEESLD